MSTVWGIIRTGKIDQDHINIDLEYLHEDISNEIDICIPTVRLLKYQLHTKQVFYNKALLFNYGFIKVPLEIAYNFPTLQRIYTMCKSVNGFVWRNKQDLKQERLAMSKGFGVNDMGEMENSINPDDIKQVIFETVDSEEVDRLRDMALGLDVYHSMDELSIGAYIILKGYPFANMVGKVLTRGKKNIKVELLDTGMIVMVQAENIYYSPYDETSPNKEISFTELGYIPDV